jgi:hypothetical protein
VLRHYLAALTQRRYRREMKIGRWLVAILFGVAASSLAVDELALRLQPALEAITPDGLLAHIKILASDEFEGRAPGTKGEELSVKYIGDQFKQIGLKPGNPDGSYVQEVPLAGIKSEPRVSFTVGDKTTELKYSDDFVASSARLQPEIKVNNSDVVFVGHGIVAPEYGWDDYKDANVRGKTILMLIPLYPLEKTLADINIDTVNPWGKTRDIEDLSNNNSTLDDMLATAAKRNGRVMTPNSQPEKGSFYRADHFEFSKRGVPSLYTGGGKDFIGKPADFGQQKKDDYTAHRYHQVSDEVDPNWDLLGAVQDIDLLFEVGYQVANGDKAPEWKPGTEFKTKRDEMMKK